MKNTLAALSFITGALIMLAVADAHGAMPDLALVPAILALAWGIHSWKES